MITSFLKLHPKIQRGEIDPAKNLGVLLIEFFELVLKPNKVRQVLQL
jgi:DNA polymerase sigma